jgi:hypothetical protein
VIEGVEIDSDDGKSYAYSCWRMASHLFMVGGSGDLPPLTAGEGWDEGLRPLDDYSHGHRLHRNEQIRASLSPSWVPLGASRRVKYLRYIIVS